MMVLRVVRVARIATLVLVGGLPPAWALAVTTAVRHPDEHTFPALLAAVGGWTLVVCAGWWAALCAAAAVEVVTAGRLPATAWTGCPSSLRRLLVGLLGLALGGAAPAAAAVAAGPAPYACRDTGAPTLLAVPARPSDALAPGPRHHVVGPGDTLWALAASGLAPDATARRVAAAVHRLHAANRTVVGPDPDLIRPGQRLVLPRPPELPGHATSPAREERP